MHVSFLSIANFLVTIFVKSERALLGQIWIAWLHQRCQIILRNYWKHWIWHYWTNYLDAVEPRTSPVASRRTNHWAMTTWYKKCFKFFWKKDLSDLFFKTIFKTSFHHFFGHLKIEQAEDWYSPSSTFAVLCCRGVFS